MSGIIGAEMASSATETLIGFEKQYSLQTAEITSKIGQLHTLLPSEGAAAVQEIRRSLGDVNDLLEQMEIVVRELPSGSTERSKYELRVRSYLNDKKQLDGELEKAIKRVREEADRDELLAFDDAIDAHRQEDQLIENTQRMERTSRKIQDSYRIAVETEQIGAEVLSNLNSQRETLGRARDRMRASNADLGRASRTLNTMIRRAIQNRLLLLIVAVLLLFSLVYIIYRALTPPTFRRRPLRLLGRSSRLIRGSPKEMINIMRTLCCFLLAFVEFGDLLEHSISWNSTNVLFRTANDPSIDVRIGDGLRFICPEFSPTEEPEEFLIVYEVSELAYGECLLETTSREVLRCNKNTKSDALLQAGILSSRHPKSVVQNIRTINPIPNGREFQPGQTYYYITTSTGSLDGIDNRYRGLCEASNMRVGVRILPKSASEAKNEDVVQKPPPFPAPRNSLDEIVSSAGVPLDQLQKVAQLAQEGRTGSFQITPKNADKGLSHWEPVQIVTANENPFKLDTDDNFVYERDSRHTDDYVIHEDVRSLSYSSSSTFFFSPTTTSFTIIFFITQLFL
ncbi:unnamed protein product [Caenorhabditis auriculariae]|uniref:Ephrin RBD domain-containing protein n=1 Tax=Caenorhabditis auriculariae TaxID=2777116 RepID=A0A8S1HHM8_9PELO|nr:unnamed protein product [Caenorhabditis auriculariae]